MKFYATLGNYGILPAVARAMVSEVGKNKEER